MLLVITVVVIQIILTIYYFIFRPKKRQFDLKINEF